MPSLFITRQKVQRPRRPSLSSLLISLSKLLLIFESAFSFIPVTLFPLSRRDISLWSLVNSGHDIDTSSSQNPKLQQQQQQQQDVVIVGGGIGGLAVAARIAASSSTTTSKVVILEKNTVVGGRCGSFWVDRKNNEQKELFRHEQGPSLLLLPSIYEEIFTETTNKTASDYGLDIVQCVPAYQVIFDDGDRISVGFPAATSNNNKKGQIKQQQQQEEALSRAKMDTFETNGATKWDDYMDITSAYLNAGLPNFIEERFDPTSLPEFLIQSLKNFGRAWPLKPHSDVLDEIFDSNKLKALASFQDLYVGLEPYRNGKLLGGGVFQSTAPAVFGLLAAIELHPTNDKAGVFAPIGGFQAVTSALERLVIDLGVDIQCNTTVTGVTNDGVWIQKLQSSNSDGTADEFISANLVIVNADLPYAKKSLLLDDSNGDNYDNSANNNSIRNESYIHQQPPTEKFDWDDNFSFSSGVVSFYWSLDKSLDDLNTHNVFLSTKTRSQAEASWQVLRDQKQQKASPEHTEKNENGNDQDDYPFNFYVHRPSKTDPSVAPSNCDAIMVLVPCNTLLRDEECSKLPRKEAMDRYQQQFPPEAVLRIRRAVLKRFAAVETLNNLEDHIIHEEYRTPATWADRYNVAAGTPFALSHGFAQLSLTRPGPDSSRLPNVLYCGASTKPGNGVPLVLIGAKQVAEKANSILASSEHTKSS